jgi:hypothetical protein
MAKILTTNDKINIRAWLKRYKNVGIDQSVLIGLPVSMLPKIVYAFSGRSIGKTDFVKPVVIRGKTKFKPQLQALTA